MVLLLIFSQGRGPLAVFVLPRPQRRDVLLRLPLALVSNSTPVVNSSSSSGAARLVCWCVEFWEKCYGIYVLYYSIHRLLGYSLLFIDCVICLYIDYSWSFWHCSGLCAGKNAAAVYIGRSCELRHRSHPSSRQRGCASPTPNNTNCTASTDCRSTCTVLGYRLSLGMSALASAMKAARYWPLRQRPVISILFPQKWRRLQQKKPPLAARHGSRRDPYGRGMCSCDAEHW